MRTIKTLGWCIGSLISFHCKYDDDGDDNDGDFDNVDHNHDCNNDDNKNLLVGVAGLSAAIAAAGLRLGFPLL